MLRLSRQSIGAGCAKLHKSLKPLGAVVLEIKPGPYEPLLDKEFANWGPF